MNLDQTSVAEIHETDGELNESRDGLVTNRKKNISGATNQKVVNNKASDFQSLRETSLYDTAPSPIKHEVESGDTIEHLKIKKDAPPAIRLNTEERVGNLLQKIAVAFSKKDPGSLTQKERIEM